MIYRLTSSRLKGFYRLATPFGTIGIRLINLVKLDFFYMPANSIKDWHYTNKPTKKAGIAITVDE